MLFLNDGSNVVTDAGALAKTKVTAEIIDQHKGDKQIVFKFKKRKGYKRTRGHRQQLTRLCIVDVNGAKASAPAPKKAAAKKPAKAEKPAKAAKPAAEKPVKAEAKKAAQPVADVDFNKMTVAELKDYAKEHDIKLPERCPQGRHHRDHHQRRVAKGAEVAWHTRRASDPAAMAVIPTRSV